MNLTSRNGADRALIALAPPKVPAGKNLTVVMPLRAGGVVEDHHGDESLGGELRQVHLHPSIRSARRNAYVSVQNRVSHSATPASTIVACCRQRFGQAEPGRQQR